MGMEPNIEFTGEPTFRHPQRVQHRSHYIQETHQYQPTQTLLAELVEPTLDDAVVDCRNDTAQTEGHEDGRSERSPGGLGKFVPQADHDAGDAEGADDAQIHHLRFEMAVESVVEPWYEGTHDQERYTAII